MQHFPTSPTEAYRSAWRNRSLILDLARRDVIGRYRGSVIGIFWSLIHPILMLTIFTFVFSVVLKMRWTSELNSRTEFALVLFSGLMVFNPFSDCPNRAPGLILNNVNYVKKVVFPLEILPWVTLASALFHLLINVSVWMAFHSVLFGWPKSTQLWFPVLLIPVILVTLGTSWFLASLGVYLRDVGQFTGVATTAMMFLSPIFYPLASVPERFRGIYNLNPLTRSIEQIRDALMWGHAPDVGELCLQLVFTSAFAWLGFAWFQKTRKGFADVL